MGILDGIPLFLAKAGAATPSLSSPLVCLFFSAQWCPGEFVCWTDTHYMLTTW